jgi:2,3-bisphosphoglycerate-dependent phosphoglycerate mutase
MSHTLVLLRHGHQWNLENRFTGWTDVGLTERGIVEARTAGASLLEAGVLPDTAQRLWLPVRRSWRLNERHYGALQGLNKAETTAEHGEEQVHIWRRSYDVPPPPLDAADERHPRHDVRYSDLTDEQLPAAESLADVVARMLPYWDDVIVPELRAGSTPIVSAHGNSLRALVKHLDGISDAEIPALNIPTGVPLVYTLDGDLSAVTSKYLGDPDEIEAAAAAVAAQANPDRNA